jgi:HPt (histidine-containing phosphotransfer) domain-containing protein
MAEVKYPGKTNTPIAYQFALERVGGDESFLEELLDLYLEDFPQKMEQLQMAIEQKKFELIRKLGHSLKGSSGTLSLTFLQEASFQMEMAGGDKDIVKAHKSLAFLRQEFKRLEDFLSEKKAKSANRR